MGIPKTGVFGLYDLIGIDLMADVVGSLCHILPKDDAFHAFGHENKLISSMISSGLKGDKGGAGFYKIDPHGRKLALQICDTNTDAFPNYAEVTKRIPLPAELALKAIASQEEPLKPLIKSKCVFSKFSRRVLARILAYAADLIPDVTENPQDIDDAMKLGFNWQRGPFELIDAIGLDTMHDPLNEAELEHKNIEKYPLQS